MNYYEILGISNSATNKEIKKAYKTLVKKYHPDVFKGDKSLAEAKIKKINEAYETLSDPKLKLEYDNSLFDLSSNFSNFDNSDFANNSSTSYNSNTYNTYNTSNDSKRYEDFYRYNYYKKYSTNYYGRSRDNLNNKNTNNTQVENPNVSIGSKQRFIIMLGLGTLFVLISLLVLLSTLKSFLSSEFKNFLGDDLTSLENFSSTPYITFDMTFDEVKKLLGTPDSTEFRANNIYAYWKTSYIIFDKNYSVIGWKNNGAFYTDTRTGEESKQIQYLYNTIQNSLNNEVNY